MRAARSAELPFLMDTVYCGSYNNMGVGQMLGRKMESDSERCQAFTRHGERCQKRSREESKYCHIHQAEYEEVKRFLNRHPNGIRGYIWAIIAGVTTDKVLDFETFLSRLLLSRNAGSREKSLSHQRFDTSIRDPDLPYGIDYFHESIDRYVPLMPPYPKNGRLGPAPLPSDSREDGYYELIYTKSHGDPERPLMVSLVYNGVVYDMGRIRDGLISAVTDRDTGRTVLRVHQLIREGESEVRLIFYDYFYRNGELLESSPQQY